MGLRAQRAKIKRCNNCMDMVAGHERRRAAGLLGQCMCVKIEELGSGELRVQYIYIHIYVCVYSICKYASLCSIATFLVPTDSLFFLHFLILFYGMTPPSPNQPPHPTTFNPDPKQRIGSVARAGCTGYPAHCRRHRRHHGGFRVRLNRALL